MRRGYPAVIAIGVTIAVLGGAASAAVPAMGSDAELGHWILHEWYQPGKDTKDLFLARMDGSDRHVVMGDVPGDRRAAVWSPDGGRVAFATRDDATPNGSIWTSDPDGSNARQLFDPTTDCPMGAYHPAWSPDGLRLAIICYPADRVASLAIVDLATLDLTTLASVEWPEFLDNPASWSPDGSTLVFAILHWDPTDTFLDGSLLATIPASGAGVPTRLSGFDSFDASPAWHPTDDLIAFNRIDLGNTQSTTEPSNISTMRSDGSDRRQVTSISVDGFPEDRPAAVDAGRHRARSVACARRPGRHGGGVIRGPAYRGSDQPDDPDPRCPSRHSPDSLSGGRSAPRGSRSSRPSLSSPSQLGHSTIVLSSNTYGHVLEQRQRQVARATDAVLGG